MNHLAAYAIWLGCIKPRLWRFMRNILCRSRSLLQSPWRTDAACIGCEELRAGYVYCLRLPLLGIQTISISPHLQYYIIIVQIKEFLGVSFCYVSEVTERLAKFEACTWSDIHWTHSIWKVSDWAEEDGYENGDGHERWLVRYVCRCSWFLRFVQGRRLLFVCWSAMSFNKQSDLERAVARRI